MEDLGSEPGREPKLASWNSARDWSDGHQVNAWSHTHRGEALSSSSCPHHLAGLHQSAVPLGKGFGDSSVYRRHPSQPCCWSHANSSKVSSLSAFAVASMCESLYPMLANRVDNYHPTAQGVMTSFVGRKTLAGLWILSVLSLLATILWIIDAVRSKEILGAGTTKGGAPMFKVPKIVRRTTGGLFGEKHRYENTSYDTLRPSSRGPSRGPSRSGSQEYLTGKIDHRRSHSREPSVGPPRGPSEDTTSTVLHDVAQLLDEKVASQSRYEPFRHRDLS